MKSSGEIKLFTGILVGALALVAVAVLPNLLGPRRDKDHVTPAPPKVTPALLMPPGSHIRGNPAAPYSLVEFGDYQCPTCLTAHNDIKEILKTYKDKLRLVYHHYQVRDRKSTRLNSSHSRASRMPSSA